MSSFASIAVLVALLIANVFLIVAMDRWVDAIVETIVTGVVRGVQVPMTHRHRLLQVNLLTSISGYVGAEAVLVVAWVVIGRQAPYDEVRWLAYLFAFPNAVAVAGWLLALPLYYRHLAGILRDTEAGS